MYSTATRYLCIPGFLWPIAISDRSSGRRGGSDLGSFEGLVVSGERFGWRLGGERWRSASPSLLIVALQSLPEEGFS